MSCFIMRPESIWMLANTLESVLNAAHFSGELTITTSALMCAPSCAAAFADCKPSPILEGVYADQIADALWRINSAAYAGRYRRDPQQEPLPPCVAGTGKSLYDRPVYGDHREQPQPWHYHLCRLLDCWLYQTDEDATRKDEKRVALQAFATALKSSLVTHSPEYNAGRWGE
jgi:hypothetical protein